MSEHAPYAPSSAHRWLQCPASLIARGEKETTSMAAERGTAMHEVAAALLEGDISDQPINMGEAQYNTKHDLDGEEEHTVNVYVNYVRNLVTDEAKHANTVVYGVEQRVHPHSISPDLWGTADCFAWVAAPPKLHIIDFKTGFMPVAAVGNPQLFTYALGILQRDDGPIDYEAQVVLTIVQPRLGQIISSYVVDPGELEYWTKRLKFGILAHQDFPHVRVPGSWCSYCDHEFSCPSRQSYAQAQTRGILPSGHSDDPSITPAEAIVLRTPAIRREINEAMREVYINGSEHVKVTASTFRNWTPEGLATLRKRHGADKVPARYSKAVRDRLALTDAEVDEFTEVSRTSYNIKTK